MNRTVTLKTLSAAFALLSVLTAAAIAPAAIAPAPRVADTPAPVPVVAEPAPVVAVPVVAAPAPVPVPAVEEPVSKYRPLSDFAAGQGRAPLLGVKTNLLYGLGTLTPNLSAEVGLGRRTSLEIGGSYNPWNLKRKSEQDTDNRKLLHAIVKPEFRYWLCERFDGHFFGVHALWARYNIDGHRVPGLFDAAYRYDGYGVGGGVTYGYSLAFAKRWNVEFAVGAGVARLDYDRYDCGVCNTDSVPETKWYFGPTNASVSIVFLIK
jgi:hypothetical protein